MNTEAYCNDYIDYILEDMEEHKNESFGHAALSHYNHSADGYGSPKVEPDHQAEFINTSNRWYNERY